MPVSRDDVIAVYREILGREPENEAVIEGHLAGTESIVTLAKRAAYGVEFTDRVLRQHSLGHLVGELAGRRYEVIRTGATYAPWASDNDFQQTFGAVRGHTLVDLYRCWNLWHLVAQVARRCSPAEHFVEVGVWRGGTAMLMARRMAMLGLSQPIYLCDTFEGVVKAGVHDPHYVGGEHSDTSIAIVRELAARLSLSNYEISVGVFPEQRPALLDNGSIGFCHIDVDAYESAKDCFNFVWPRMVPGGVVIFDDYGSFTTSGVAKLVDESLSGAGGIWQYNLNGHAVATKVPN